MTTLIQLEDDHSQCKRDLLIGIGHPDRGDDAFGLLVAREIARLVGPDVTVVECPGDAGTLIDLWSGAGLVVVVDVVRTGADPGSMVRLNARTERVPSGPATSSHGLGLAEAVSISQKLDLMPESLWIYGIEGGCFDPGRPLSVAVATGVKAMARRIIKECLLADAGPAGPRKRA